MPVLNAEATTAVLSIAYTYNATEQMTKETDTGAITRTRSYTYDANGRLTSADRRPIAYNAETEPTTLGHGETATYDQAGELTSPVNNTITTTYAYDTLGDRTSTTRTTGVLVGYQYNAAGELVTETRSGTKYGFQYNGDGLRVGLRFRSYETAQLIWDTAGTTPGVLSDGLTDYVYGANGQVVEQLYLAVTRPTYLIHDRLGSTRALVNETGSVVNTYVYDAYGELTKSSITVTTPFAYASQWTTQPARLEYLVNRSYTRTLGMFLTVDPLLATTTQPYVYANKRSGERQRPPRALLFGALFVQRGRP